MESRSSTTWRSMEWLCARHGVMHEKAQRETTSEYKQELHPLDNCLVQILDSKHNCQFHPQKKLNCRSQSDIQTWRKAVQDHHCSEESWIPSTGRGATSLRNCASIVTWVEVFTLRWSAHTNARDTHSDAHTPTNVNNEKKANSWSVWADVTSLEDEPNSSLSTFSKVIEARSFVLL